MNSYYLRVKFGDTDVPLSISNLRELTVVQDMHRFLPEFRMKVVDATGAITHVLPFDKKMNTAFIEWAQDLDSETPNSITFDVYQSEPDSDQSTPATIYDIQGLMSIEGLMGPDYSRSFSGNVDTSLTAVATEFGTDEIDISSSLAYSKDLIQPYQSNIQFLSYYRDRLIGANGEHTYKCFIKVSEGTSTFVFKNIEELISDQVSYKFSLSDTKYEDRYPIFNYAMYNNYKSYIAFAAQSQAYAYFDYNTTEFVRAEESIDDYLSLTDYFLVDTGDTSGSNCLVNYGRNNDFTTDFKGPAKSSYGNRLYGMVKLWITTQGLTNACPGQTVEVFFPFGLQADALCSYQYSGYWLVERVVHNFGGHFLTKLLLTRNGLDTDQGTTLLPATMKKRV